jgi:hypothetical protein
MDGFIERSPLKGFKCIRCGADTHEPEQHRNQCAATWKYRAEIAERDLAKIFEKVGEILSFNIQLAMRTERKRRKAVQKAWRKHNQIKAMKKEIEKAKQGIKRNTGMIVEIVKKQFEL